MEGAPENENAAGGAGKGTVEGNFTVPVNPRLHSANGTPVMNSIQEEESPETANAIFQTPYLNLEKNRSSVYLDMEPTPGSLNKSAFASPKLARPNSSFYGVKDGNSSSSSIIYNPSFSFGGAKDNNNTSTDATATTNLGGTGSPKFNTTSNEHEAFNQRRRGSTKYIPGVRLGPPTSRNRSPVRSPSPDRTKKSSTMLDSPFNFNTTSLNPHTPPASASRAQFRKGHRYKHSSVSMNFFQEPEVKIPLNIAKSLPIPDLRDILHNLSWPKAYSQLLVVSLQVAACLITYELGHSHSWNDYLTLSHFIAYDIVGSLVIIFVETLSQFEVWFTGSLTFPFGLNRIDVLLSFASAVSLCFVGLDLIFHVVEEIVVVFVEAPKSEHHDNIAATIPHSHYSTKDGESIIQGNNLRLWYTVLGVNALLAVLSLSKIYNVNANCKLKTKNPLVTMAYILYLVVFPFLEGGALSNISDYLATLLIATFIIIHGYTIAGWTSTILLNGFSTTEMAGLALLDYNSDQSLAAQDTTAEISSKEGSQAVKGNTRPRSYTHLPTSTVQTRKKKSLNHDPSVVKSLIKDNIENLPEFKHKCDMKNSGLLISKISFDLYIVLINVTLRNGSNEEEQRLFLAIDKCVKRYLPYSETTIEIDRI
ncbi:Zn(2+) transporter ZRG17 KNAG_0D00290 [Huiozyma naganishii CBS 8797]|uniref:Protein ZRG17 n=1 Tax=Huiozyma naganishii (strain ATCC MYA-139 / BCRC 22969 / CBS 8797 / KCTC 17520 / NBRC 10181 / NCYC 3082 / Yp74L-3) TaxID=1071383 RepID=J7RXH3_HUIN7|nr:hypothetical protein KNAG_0D00290 [Kazachstania naganishii CBS 8797]CCK69782.1 hypothetical protein KNAG_0D00290 [Kazachstania naganishii CBS 8797]